jgi:hypothetical protein
MHERPVLQVHVRVSDQRIEDEATDELDEPGLAHLDPDHSRDVAIACAFVLALGVDAEHLGEVFDVNARTVRGTIETPDRENTVAVQLDAFRQALNVPHGQQARFGHVDADAAGQRHHREFVFRNAFELRGRKLHDPRSADSVRRNGQSTGCPLNRGELQLHARERKPQRRLLIVLNGIVQRGVLKLARQGFFVLRDDLHRPGEVTPEYPGEIELALRLHARSLREIVPKRSFRAAGWRRRAAGVSEWAPTS